jgi:hypothetical protein
VLIHGIRNILLAGLTVEEDDRRINSKVKAVQGWGQVDRVNKVDKANKMDRVKRAVPG